MVTDDELPARLRAARAYAGLSREELADRLPPHLTHDMLRRMETGRRGADEATLELVAEACGLPSAWFSVADWSEALGARHAREREELEVREQLAAVVRYLVETHGFRPEDYRA